MRQPTNLRGATLPGFFPAQRKGGATPHTLPTAKAPSPAWLSLFHRLRRDRVSYFRATKHGSMAASENKLSALRCLSFEEPMRKYLWSVFNPDIKLLPIILP